MAELLPPPGVRSWWWCKHCHSYVDLLEPGAPYPQCERCRGRVYLQEPVEERPVSPAVLSRAPLPDWNPDAKPVARPRRKRGLSRLPAEKRNLCVLAKTGYWFCYECQEITEEGKDRAGQANGECVLCGEGLDRKINWNEPVGGVAA